MTDLYVEPIVETNEDVKSQEIDSLERGISQPTEGPPSAQPASSQSYIPDSQVSTVFLDLTNYKSLMNRCRLRHRGLLELDLLD